MKHALQFVDASDQYKLIIKDTNNLTIQNIYSKFQFLIFPYFQININKDPENNKKIQNFLLCYFKNFKFITLSFNCKEKNNFDILDVSLCVENYCIIIKDINFDVIQDIISKLKENQISILNVGHEIRDIAKTIEDINATEEVKSFCSEFNEEIINNLEIKNTISSISGFIIRRYYYPSTYFKDISFFTFDSNSNKSKEEENKTDFYNFIFTKYQFDNYQNYEILRMNFCQKMKELMNKVIINEQNCKEKPTIQYFKENDFIKLKTFHNNNYKFVFSLNIHRKSLYLFMIKMITEEGYKSKQTYREIDFCKNFSNNRCLTKFYGFVTDKNNKNIGFVYEYMTNGDLLSFINNQKEISKMFSFNILMRINHALNYLHKKLFIFRDLKPDNILIDHDFNIYLSDFETIRHPLNENENEEMTYDFGFNFYASPEQQQGKKVLFSSDIYSFGQLMNFLFKKIDKKKVSNILFKLYQLCIKYKPEERPTIEDIKHILLDESNSFTIFEDILTNDINNINKSEIIQFIYELLVNIIQIRRNDFLEKCLQIIFCFRKLYLHKAFENDSSLYLNLGIVYMMIGHDVAIYQDLFKAEKYYLMAAKKNNPRAQNNLGIMYLKGIVGDKNYSKAIEYFELAAKQNDPDGLFNLGNLYENGYALPKNYTTARKYYEMAAALNHSESLNRLGNIYENGLDIKQDYKKAKQYYELAAKLMNPDALYNLGFLFYQGLGVEVDYNKAKLYFEQSAELYNSDSYNALGMIYLKGEGVTKNLKEAKRNFEISAQMNNSYGLYNLGFMYLNGEGVEKNYEKAKYYLDLSAQQQNSDAICKLGFLYMEGLGVTKDCNKAKELYELAASYDNSFAYFYLGFLYYNINHDYVKAKNYFEISAQKNNIIALYYLGNIYKFGLGVKQNFIKANFNFHIYQLVLIFKIH